MSDTHIIVFEDEWYQNFYPISESRPVYHVLAGAKTAIERISHHFKGFEISCLCRPFLADLYGKTDEENSLERIAVEDSGKVILINGACVIRQKDSLWITELKNTEKSVAWIDGDRLVAAVLPAKMLTGLENEIQSLYEAGHTQKIVDSSDVIKASKALLFSYIWNPMLENPEMIESDFKEYYSDKCKDDSIGDSFVYGRDQIYTGTGVRADANSVIDARKGPVILEDGVEIQPFCRVEGPAFIGKDTKLVGGKIVSGCSIGPGCRIGGEVEQSIFIANTNKYHDGFIGHAYIGEWVNLGALTTNSDLKNNYSEIDVCQNGKRVMTGSMKIGCFIGDHTKIGIGMTINTGCNIGFSINLFGGSFIMGKEIPSFVWGDDNLRLRGFLSHAVETAKTVMERRGHVFDQRHEKLFEYLHDRSKEAIAKWTKGGRKKSKK